MRNHLKDILIALIDGDVHFVVAGGVAAVLHGVERVTMDLDIALDLRPDNIDRFGRVMEALGMRPRIPVPLDALKDPEAVRIMVEEKGALVFSLIHPSDPLRYLDVFMAKQLSFSHLAEDAVLIDLDGRAVSVVGREKLLALKRGIHPPRDKDLWDIRELERIISDEQTEN